MKKPLLVFVFLFSFIHPFSQLAQEETSKIVTDAHNEIVKLKKDPTTTDLVKQVPNIAIDRKNQETSQLNAGIKLKPASKPENPTAVTKKTYWYLGFTVTIKGSGKEATENLEDITEWSVDRTYSGNINLNDSMPWYKPGLSALEAAEARKANRFTAYNHIPSDVTKINQMPLKVTIRDRIATTILDEGEGNSFEKHTNEKIWETKGVVTVSAQNAVQVTFDRRKLTYNVSIPLLTIDGKKHDMLATYNLITDRSDFGYGDAPTHEKDSFLLPKFISNIPIPEVAGIIKNGMVQHIPEIDYPFTTPRRWSWDSGNKQPDKPIFEKAESSQRKVNIKVVYHLSRTPIE